MASITIRGGQTVPMLDAAGQQQGNGFNTVFATGTWSSGVLTTKVRPGRTNIFHSLGQTLSADGFFNFQAKYSELQFSLSGATTQSLTVTVL